MSSREIVTRKFQYSYSLLNPRGRNKMVEASGGLQFLMLLYKGLLLRKRHFILTALEILIPILISSVMLLVLYIQQEPNPSSDFEEREHLSSVLQNATIYPPFDPFHLKKDGFVNIVHLLYTPDTEIAKKFIDQTISLWTIRTKFLGRISRKAMSSEEELVSFALHKNDSLNSEIIGIVLNNFSANKLPTSLDYKIRYSSPFNSFSTNMKYRIDGPQTYSAYTATYFLSWQAAVESSFIQKVLSAKFNEPSDLVKMPQFQVMMKRFPYPQHIITVNQNFAFNIPWVLWYGFLIFTFNLVRSITEEKSNGSKELMKMMGMTDFIYWLATFVNYFIVGAIIILAICVMYKIPIHSSAVLQETDFILLFVILLLLMASTILFTLSITTLITHRILSGIFLVIVIITSVALFSVKIFNSGPSSHYYLMGQAEKLSICLFPVGATFTIFTLISTLEASGEGAQWSNVMDYGENAGISLLLVMGMMVVSCFMYIILIWYLDAVCPWQYGVTKPFYFPFTKHYWFGKNYISPPDQDNPSVSQASNFIEEDPIGSSPGVVLKNLSKTFKTGLQNKLAVKNISLNVYSGQITALLGLNGAGKTTTINILTGLFSPTSGTATIDGWDILSQTTNARRSLGVCPQRNMLYDTLTPEEHLKFYAGLKGVRCSDLASESKNILEILHLTEKKSELVRNLSGGMKRKLSLGIALIGGSKVLFLDEPTSGMDPEARRSVWDALLDMRDGRTIILTTHYMEEADILGDRIAIMADGEIQCCGSPIFLKKKLGTGYKLHVVKEESFDLNGVTEVLHTFTPEATIEKEDEKEVTFNLLCGSDTSLGDMFEQMESLKSHLGIGSYGVSVTTMEDVFLNAANIADVKLHSENSEPENSSENVIDGKDLYTPQQKLAKSHTLVLNQLWALLTKRFQCSKRSWHLLLLQVGLPFIVILIMAYSLRSKPQQRIINTLPSLNMSLENVYGKTKGFYHSSNSTEAKLFAGNYLKKVFEENQVLFPEDRPDFNAQNYVLHIGSKNLADYSKNLIIGGTVEGDKSLTFTAWYNGEPYHAMPIALNVMHNAILRSVSKAQQASPSISLANAPLPYATTTEDHGTTPVEIARIVASVMVPLALSFVAAPYVLHPIEENICRSKLLQLMTGLPVWLYWLAMFCWDGWLHLIISILLLIPFSLFGLDSVFFAHSEIIGSIFLLLLLYGWCSIPFCYVISFLFKKSNRGYQFILTICIITGIILSSVMTVILVSIGGPMNTDLPDAITICMWWFRIFPSFSVSNGISNVFNIAFSHDVMCNNMPNTTYELLCNQSTINSPENPMFKCCTGNSKGSFSILSWDFDKCGREVFFMASEGIFFFTLLLFLETTIPRSLWRHLKRKIKAMFVIIRPTLIEMVVHDSAAKDSEVSSEEQRIEDLWSTESFDRNSLMVYNMSKVYGSMYAVDHLSFGVHKKECFGLLGVNGAGKTTTFKMITGDVLPSDGNACIHRTSLVHNRKEFQSFIGYCPQYDALLGKMTAIEMLTLFARLRGLTGKDVRNSVSQLIRMVDLQEHADKLTTYYSGGNKRKLSLALALIGTPPLILLDEPTSGVDPASRRKIWKILRQARSNAGAAIILTTHSMEESEALCNRLAIMVNGKFRCLGSLQQLKTKYGTGYIVVIKLKREEFEQDETMSAQKADFNENFPGADLTDDHKGMLQYHIRDTSVPLSRLFKFMDDMKKRFNLADYLISGTSLEQIFLAFARTQRHSDHDHI